jgi:ATP-dependent DNA ligase
VLVGTVGSMDGLWHVDAERVFRYLDAIAKRASVSAPPEHQIHEMLASRPLFHFLRTNGGASKEYSSKYDSKRSGAWIKIKLYQQGSFVIGGYTQPGGERRHMGALLVGVNENGKLKFAGRVGTGFSEKLLKFLSLELNKIAVNLARF